MIHSAGEEGFWPEHVVAVYSDRLGGVSQAPFDSFNLGDHVGDSAASVQENRRQLLQNLPGCERLQWLQQVHGTGVLQANRSTGVGSPEADAAVTSEAGIGLTVMTADCLPVLISDASGHQLSAVHAGWRGLLAGVLESAIDCFTVPATQLRIWLGPCIGARQFEVGPEVREAFLADRTCADFADRYFVASGGGRYLADLKALARARLERCGVNRIAVSADCTFEQDDLYFSYRRDGQCGRMVSLIYRRSA